jgi:hypothetical protein
VSAGEGPGGRDDRTRRVERPDGDATRAIDRDATRAVDPGATRRIDPGATGAVPGSADPTQVMGPTADDDDGYVTVPNRPPGEPRPEDEALVVEEEEPERNRARDWVIGLSGVAAGVLLAVLVAFLAGGDREPDAEVAAAEEQVAALEAERDALAAENDALEAEVADARAAAGQSDADLDAQRSALDDRAAALDERATALDGREDGLNQREDALNQRDRSLDEREAAIADREAEAPAGDGDGTGDDGGGGDLVPDIDAEDVEGFFDQILDRIRDLF